jgi:hypothetical protein
VNLATNGPGNSRRGERNSSQTIFAKMTAAIEPMAVAVVAVIEAIATNQKMSLKQTQKLYKKRRNLENMTKQQSGFSRFIWQPAILAFSGAMS